MQNRPAPYPQRYSRPPSLSTISSNEEADFSTSRRNLQTFPNTYLVSPLEEQATIPHYYPQYPPFNEPRPELNEFQDRSMPVYSAAYQREQLPIGDHHDEYLVSASSQEKATLGHELERPQDVHTRSDFVNAPRMERSETSFSDQASSHTLVDAPKKYMKTRYMWMLLQLDQIPWWHNLLAAVSSWIILAAYLVVPGTFTSIQNNQKGFDPKNITNTPEGQFDAVTHQIVDSIDHLGLLIFSAILAGIGALMCLLLFFLHWQNYVWLSWKIFQPMTLNAAAGLLTTVVNVMTAQKGVWSVTAKINASVTGSVVFVAGGLFILYNFMLIEGVRKQHRKHFPLDAELVDPMKQRRIGRYLPSQKGF